MVTPTTALLNKKKCLFSSFQPSHLHFILGSKQAKLQGFTKLHFNTFKCVLKKEEIDKHGPML